jgi:hypothetical protein
MPNGGPDNCGHCFHNPDGGWCHLRDLMIVDRMWTYCANVIHKEPLNAEIVGPVYSSGLYEGYVRIPWLGDRRPKSGKQVKCYKCGDFVENGIELELRSGEKFGFCCNKNYFEWWVEQADTDEKAKKVHRSFDKLNDCPKDTGQPVNAFVTQE